MGPGLCGRVWDAEYRYSPTVGDYVLQVELVNPEGTRFELYRFLPETGRLHHWVDDRDRGHQGTDAAFEDVYRRLEQSGFLSRTYLDRRVRRVMEAIGRYAAHLRNTERQVATSLRPPPAHLPPSAGSESARRKAAVNECRDALGLPRL